MVAGVSCRFWTHWRWRCQSFLELHKWTLELWWVTSMQNFSGTVLMCGKFIRIQTDNMTFYFGMRIYNICVVVDPFIVFDTITRLWLFQLYFFLTGTSLFPSWFSWTAYLVTCHCSSLLSGARDQKQICTMLWSICSLAQQMTLGRTSYLVARRLCRYVFLIDKSLLWSRPDIIVHNNCHFLCSLFYFYLLWCPFLGCWFQSLFYWRSNMSKYAYIASHILLLLCAFQFNFHWLFLCLFSIRGIRATNTQCFRTPMNQWEQSWGSIMMTHMTMRSLSSAKFLFTKWSTRLNLFLVQSQTQLRTFVFGLWGNAA